MSGGSGEQGLLPGACAQMLQFYDLPNGAAAGMADSKMPDAQSGYEKGTTLVMAGLSGLIWFMKQLECMHHYWNSAWIV